MLTLGRFPPPLALPPAKALEACLADNSGFNDNKGYSYQMLPSAQIRWLADGLCLRRPGKVLIAAETIG